MEEEKLQEAQRTFEEDCEKFNKYLEDQQNKATHASEVTKNLTKQKNDLFEEMLGINKQIQDVKTEIKKVGETLSVYKGHREFLEEIAEFVGKKKRKDTPSSMEEFTAYNEGGSKQPVRSHIGRTVAVRADRKEEGDETFLTQGGGMNPDRSKSQMDYHGVRIDESREEEQRTKQVEKGAVEVPL